MTMTHELAAKIDQVIREHVAALHAIASEAVAQAFATTARNQASRGTAAAADAPLPARAKKIPAPRRAPEVVAALAERLDAVIRATPGETMATLAPKVGVSGRELEVVVARLRRAGRVRSIGQRQHTRYFPMTGDTPVSA
jgi:hypothetical protein